MPRIIRRISQPFARYDRLGVVDSQVSGDASQSMYPRKGSGISPNNPSSTMEVYIHGVETLRELAEQFRYGYLWVSCTPHADRIK